MRHLPTLRRVCTVLTVATLTACGGSERDKESAARAMDQFHARYNESEYGKIYDTAGPEFQEKNVRGDFLQRLAEVHHKLGDYRTCDRRSWETNLFGADTRVTLHYRTTFTAGEADEEFIYTVAGARATLRVYRIEPKR